MTEAAHDQEKEGRVGAIERRNCLRSCFNDSFEGMNHAQTTRACITLHYPCITLRLLREVKSRNVTTFPCDILLRALRAI